MVFVGFQPGQSAVNQPRYSQAHFVHLNATGMSDHRVHSALHAIDTWRKRRVYRAHIGNSETAAVVVKSAHTLQVGNRISFAKLSDLNGSEPRQSSIRYSPGSPRPTYSSASKPAPGIFPAPRPLQTAGREVMAPYDFGVFVASRLTSIVCRAARPREPIYRNKNSCRSSRILLDFRFHFSEAYRIPNEAGTSDSVANTAKL
jgi:hypothetical protein